MSLPLNIPSSSEVVLWCSYYCTGNPAEQKVDFEYQGEWYTMNMCQNCFEQLLEKGPKGSE